MQTYIRVTSKFALLALCEGNSPVTDEFPTQRASNAEKASIWSHNHNITHSLSNYRLSVVNPESDQCLMQVSQCYKHITCYNWPVITKSYEFIWWLEYYMNSPVNAPFSLNCYLQAFKATGMIHLQTCTGQVFSVIKHNMMSADEQNTSTS